MTRPARRSLLHGVVPSALPPVLLLSLALALLPGWLAGPALADSGGGVVSQGVRDRVAREGRARVLVELRLPAALAPEAELGEIGARVQQADIAAVGARVLSRLAGRLFRALHQYETVPFVALDVGADALAELEASPFWVSRVVEDELHAPALAQSVPLVGGDVAWARGFDGSGTVVAVLDTGVQQSHPFLFGKVVEEACFSSNVAGRSVSLCPSGQTQQLGPGAAEPCDLSTCYHGTHVAGIAAGNGAGAGVAFSGVARGADIMAIQVFSYFTQAADCNGSPPCVLAWNSDMLAGLERVYARRTALNLVAANMSIGGATSSSPCDSNVMKPIIDNLRAARIATVIAAGNNSRTNAVAQPGCISSAISVGATTKADVLASYSNMASFVSLLAPGSSITSSVTGSGFGVASGTSMATPHVVGAWAILRQAVPGATVNQILSALQSTGLPVTDTRSGGTVTKPRIRLDQALAQLAPGATLSVTPVSIPAGGVVTARWASIPAPTSADWIGLFTPGAADSAFISRIYVNCSPSPGGAAFVAGSCPFTVPGSVAPGTYQLRLFSGTGPTRLATSGPLTVTTAATTLSASPTSVAAGTTVTGAWSGIATPTPTDWIGVFPSGAGDSAYLQWIYVSCSQQASQPRAAGSCAVPLPGTLVAGTYELRLFNNASTRLAVSNGFTVTRGTVPTLSGSPENIPQGGSATVRWSGIPAPSALDWIGLYVPGNTDGAYLTRLYVVSCGPNPAGAGAPAGTCPFSMGGLPPGPYEFRLFANNTLTRLATSNRVTVTAPSPASLAASPASIPVGSSETVSWSGIANPTATDWIGLYLPGSPDGSYLTRLYVVSCGPNPAPAGAAAGSCPFWMGGLPPQTYEFRLFTNNTLTRLATSNPVTVTAPSPASLGATPTSIAAGSTETVTWSGIANPTATDWIGLYVPGSPDASYLTRLYVVSCGPNPAAAGAAAGSCPFSMGGLAAQTYEFRLFTSNTLARLATSNAVTVTAPGSVSSITSPARPARPR